MFLAGARIDTSLIAIVRRHASDEGAGEWMPFPIAVRDLPIAVLPIVAALPVPLDSDTFVQIASGAWTTSQALRDWITAHPTPQAHGGGL